MAFTLKTHRAINDEVQITIEGVQDGVISIKDVEDFHKMAVDEEEFELAECFRKALKKLKND